MIDEQAKRAAPGGQPANDAPLVPSRRQYLALKAHHPAAILFYRLGDFYETFDDDARIVARDARITLTSRSFGRSGRVPMAGVPHHALNHYLGRLLRAGHTVAVAEQVSPAGRGLVERAVTRVLTPGTIAETALLPPGENRYLAAVQARGDRVGLAWLDVSTGEFATMEFAGEQAVSGLREELARLNPAECLVPDGEDDEAPAWSLPGQVTRLERWHFAPERAASALQAQFGARSLTPYGCADLLAATGAAGAILAYVIRTNPTVLPMMTRLRTEAPDSRVGLDAATRRNLELTRSLGTGGSRGSLLGVLDATRTAMGARALRRLVGQPLRDLAEPRRRQAIVAALVADPVSRAALAAGFTGTGDLERLIGRVTGGQATARDFWALAAALRVVPAIVATLDRLEIETAAVDPCADVLELVEAAIVEDEEAGAQIRDGFSPELDGALVGARATRQWLTGLERQERERTGIKSLKVGYTKVFGYYIEVTRSNLSLVPDDYQRKQTVATGERYITEPLMAAEARLTAADEAIATLVRAALARVTAAVTAATGRLIATASQLAESEALLALAEVAARSGWVVPELDESDALEIVGGRHPVVEASLAGEAFIANDCRLGGDGPRQLIVTGPNMGGKSTFLRQTALIVLLAQIGSFVPATRARIGVADRIFTRVGARDDLARGQSTFMVEMVETATILHQATRRGLLILDEVGRGTSTGDGLAIARAVLEDIHDRIGARSLFATHYLELTRLAGELPGVANAHVAALERDGRVIFLYAVRAGPADRAYGIQVARLAGLPPWVADRAEALLEDAVGGRGSEVGGDDRRAEFGVRRQEAAEAGMILTPNPTPDARERGATDPEATIGMVAAEEGSPYQLGLAGVAAGPGVTARLARELRDLDVGAMTPRQALDWLYERRAWLGGRDG